MNKIDIEEVLKIIQRVNVVSLDMPIVGADDDDECTLGDLLESEGLSPEELACQQDVKDTVNKYLNKLSPRERVVLQYRFGIINGIPMTLEEIGQKYNVTRERIRQIGKTGMEKLKRFMLRDGITSWKDI